MYMRYINISIKTKNYCYCVTYLKMILRNTQKMYKNGLFLLLYIQKLQQPECGYILQI